MGIKEIILASATFSVAISGAFASSFLISTTGSVNKADRPSQAGTCELGISCSNTGEFPCQVFITSAAYPLKQLLAPTFCVTQLTHDEVFAAILP